MARVLEANVRRHDQVVRWGGEEFLVILSNVGLDDAQELVERIAARWLQVKIPAVGASPSRWGWAGWQSNETEEELLHRTDCALYQAKERGAIRSRWPWALPARAD